MLMNPPPGDSYTTPAQNRQATGAAQSLATPGVQRRPVLGQNMMGMQRPPMTPGMPQASVNPLDKQQQQALQMAQLLGRGLTA
jgi:hypothetical protein